MRYSKILLPTLRENPAEAEIVSHRLMLRAGLIKKLTAGVYSYLPIGLAAIRKVEKIVREEMNRAGALEMMMPMVQPAELWQETGRYQKYGPELLRFHDRHERECCLGPTHEEVMTDIARREIHSYRDLPINLYQVQTKFRDEIRPRFGLMRCREFIMKDAYSFDVDDEAASVAYMKMYEAYRRIFKRCGLDFRAVQADSGTIGGNYSHEFMVLAETGEDTIVSCRTCAYAANIEKAVVVCQKEQENSSLKELERVETPGKGRVKSVCDFLGIGADQLVKTMVYKVETAAGIEYVATVLPGDREVEEVKLKNLLGASEIELASDQESLDATGVASGYLGPVDCRIRLVADQRVPAMRNFYAGGNEQDYHLKNVNYGRDFTAAAVSDLCKITAADPCPECGGELDIAEGIEVGHVFKLGTGYSESMNATFQDQDGREKHLVMGCYGIGVTRIVAASIEQNHDKDGIIFPVPIAPLQVVIVNAATREKEITATAERLYDEMLAAGLDVLLDDRDERPGIKFKDADLLGIPYRVTVGKEYVNTRMIEVRERRGGKIRSFAPDKITAELCRQIEAELKKHQDDNEQ